MSETDFVGVGTILINDEGLLGDSISTIPLIEQLASQGQPIYMLSKNHHSASLIPKRLTNIHDLYRMPNIFQGQTYRLSIGNLLRKFGHTYHPTVGIFHLLGFAHLITNPIAMRPEIEYTVTDQPYYDIVISAVSRANGARTWPYSEWNHLIPQLKALGHTIAMVGVEEDGRPIEGVDYLYGLSINDVAAVLHKAKLVITIDNGISRLKHAVGGNHLLLCSNAVQINWGGYPEAHILYGPPKEFGVANVFNKVRSIT